MIHRGEGQTVLGQLPPVEEPAVVQDGQTAVQLRHQRLGALWGLPLPVGGLQEAVGLLTAPPANQVDRQVVGRVERGHEIGRRGHRSARHEPEGRCVVPEHERVAHCVDAPAARPTCELAVLARGERGGVRAAELGEPLDHHGARRHVDAQGQGLGGEHHLEQPLRKAPLDRLAEGRHQAGVVRRHPGFECCRPLPVAQGPQVVVGQALHRLLDQSPDPGPLGIRGESNAVLEALSGGVVAGRTREDEGDGRQHPGFGQVRHHLGPSGDAQPLVGRTLALVV